MLIENESLFMDERALSALFDIRESISSIQRFVNGRSKEDYDSDDMMRAAIERKYMIIGEALTRLKKIDLAVFMRIREADKIVGFRNVLAHGYDEINDDVSWMIICDKLPILKSDVNGLLI